MMGAATHVRLAAIRSASITAHFGRLHRLSQGDGVGLVLFVHILAVVVLRLAVLKEEENSIRTTANGFLSLQQPHQGGKPLHIDKVWYYLG